MSGVMMLSRDLKRVPLDFVWPLNKVWDGYLHGPEFDWPQCPECKGEFYTPEALAIANSFYALRVSEEIAWCDKLGQVEVDNLVAEGRLREYVKREPTDDNPRDWEWVSVPRTAAEVNAANGRGRSMMGDLSHDAINRGILVSFRCKALGIVEYCPTCEGHGDIATAEQRAAEDAWERTEPPAGEGFQLWESVSEGSPISPVFDNVLALAQWLAVNDTSILRGKSVDDWLAILDGGVHGTDIQTGALV